MSNIRVAVRVRPLSGKEKDDGSREIIEINRSTVTIENVKVLGIPEFGDSRTKFKEFSYDFCYDCLSREQPYATQLQVFQDLGTQVLSSALDGFNACVFAYGQTGTGKTHTMMGYPGDVGLTPRICEGLFESIDKCADEKVTCRVDISYLEIYNEQIRDLLQPEQLKQNKKQSLKIREHPKEGPYIKDLSWHRVRQYTDVQELLDRGNAHRVTAETYIHEHSSRSHAIVTVCFTQARLEENRPSEIVSKINLVDLAGSERADPSSRPDFRKRLAEGSSINKSLVTLGYVIKALAEKSLLSWSTDDMGSTQSFHGSGGGETSASSSPAGPNRQRLPFIPYRDSVLTRLLKDSLGGNSKTIMIATITPASQYYGETLSTLRYAHRAKNIINKPRINEDSNVALIRELKKEIERLREMLASAQKAGSPCEDIMYFVPSFSIQQDPDQGGNLVNLQDSEDTIIAEKLHESEAMAKQLTQSWMGKWSSTHNIMKETDLSIRNLRNRSSSMGVMIDSQLPYLVGMDDDVLSTGVVLFHLKEGETTIGREDAETAQDIVLMGPSIQREHCVIQHSNGEVRVHPLPGAMCTIQGLECTEPTRLAQGDFIVFGGDQFFRFNNPAEAAKLREHRRSQGSLNTLNTSYPSFGGLSRASSYSSIGADDPNFLSPNSLLGRSYPNRELERKHNTEQERLADARSTLEQLQEEHERAEELRLEKEEEMYSLHEQHRLEIEEQKQQLARLIEENERARQKSEEELMLAKESLAKEKEAFQQDLDIQRKKLKDLQKFEQTQESAGIQTEPLSVKTSSTDALELKGISMGTDCDHDDTIKEEVPIKKGRRMSVEDQLRELEQNEFSRRMSYRETEESLSIQQEDIEDQYYQTQEKIEEKMKKIKQVEEEYREMDKEFLSHMSEQTEKVDALHREEVQLEVYIQENEELMNVTRDVPRPLRSACSEMYLLDPNLQVPSYPVKTSSLRDINADLDKEGILKASDINILSASAESMKSDILTMETDSKEQNIKSKQEKKDSKKITSTARNVTSRLYKPPEPKFKYVPKVKEKEVKPAARPSRVRDGETKSRSSPSRFLPGHSPSPQRSEHSPSPMRQNGKRASPSPARGNEPKKLPNKPPAKPAAKKAAEKGATTKTNGKESKVMAVRNKPQGSKQTDSVQSRTFSPEFLSCDSLSSERANLSPGPGPGRPVNTKLRQMASASSLASVPESVSEEVEESTSPKAAPEPVNYVVKRRAKKGRSSLFDDEFRTHSAPDSQNMEKALDDYTLQMMSGLSPEKHSSERVIPVFNTSVSVDDSDLQREYKDSDNMCKKQDNIHSDDGLAKEEVIEEMDEGINEPSIVLGKRDHSEEIVDNLDSQVLLPRKRSKSEGADDNDIWHVTLNKNNNVYDTVQKDEHYSEDSLNTSDVSADSLEDGERKSKRLTQSLPAYLVRDEKPISDDSLNDSLEEKKNSSKEEIMETNLAEQGDKRHKDKTDYEKNKLEQTNDQTTRALSRTEVESCDVYDIGKPTPNLSVAVLPQIDINDTENQNSGEKTMMDTGTVTDKLTAYDKESGPSTSAPATVINTHAVKIDTQKLEVVNLANISYLANSDSDNEMQDEKMQDINLSAEKSDIPNRESDISTVPNNTHACRSETSVNIEVPFNATDPEIGVSFIDGQYPQIVSENVPCVAQSFQENKYSETCDNNRDIQDVKVSEVSEQTVPSVSDNATCEVMNKNEDGDLDNKEVVQKSKQFVEDIVTKAKEIVKEQIRSEAECAIQQSQLNEGCSTNGPVLEEMNVDAIDGELPVIGNILNIPASNTAEEMLQDKEVVEATETESVTNQTMECAITLVNKTEDKLSEHISVSVDLPETNSATMDTSTTDLNNSQLQLTDISKANVNETSDNVPNLYTTCPNENNGEISEMEDHKQETVLATENIMAEPEVLCDDSSVLEPASGESCELVLTKSIGVGTSLECLAIEEDAEKTLLGSDDSLIDPEKELQVLKNALDQLPARPLTSGPQLSEARRAARQRAMIRQQQRAADSDGVEPCSDESPPSGNRSKASSRPDSGSRRRRKPQSKLNDKTKQLNDHTSDDYDSSENDSVYSDGSIDNKLYQGLQNGCPNREELDNENGNYVTTDSLENSDSDTMSRRLRRQHGKGSPRYDKQRLETADIEEGPDGKRTVGIQTFDQSRVRSTSGRTDLSDFDTSCAIGELSRNMTVSPLSLWNSDRRENGSHNAQNSTSSACVGQAGSDQEKSLTPTPRSSTRSVSSVFSENSNLGRGVTDVWSNSESDLRDLSRFNDEFSFLMETESSIPGLPSSDISEDGHSSLSFAKSPREGESVTRPGCSTPKNPGQIVSISYPESQVERATNLDSDTPVTFEVTVHENNTNILYNVEKTEYKTYALKNSDSDRPRIIPDTIHVNMTENSTSKTDEKYVSNTTEDVRMHLPHNEDNLEYGNLNSERSMRSSYSSERESEIENNQVKHATAKELKESIEDHTQYSVPSNSFEEPVKKKNISLQHSGLVEATNYPASSSETDMPQDQQKSQCDVSTMDDSDNTSDYGTFISVDGRRGSDSEGETAMDGSPGISPRASHISRKRDIDSEPAPAYNQSSTSFLPIETALEITDQLDSGIIMTQSQSLCSSEDVINPIVIAGRTSQSSPVQFVSNTPLETPSENHLDDSEGPEDMLSLPLESIPESSTSPNDMLDDTDSGSCSTVRPKHTSDGQSLACSQETLEDPNVDFVEAAEADEIKTTDSKTCLVISPRQNKSASSADDLYISLEQTESNSSTCSSEYKTPQQSPRNAESNDTSEHIKEVVIPDLGDDMATPRFEEGVSSSGPVLTSSPKEPPAVRTVSVNTETAPPAPTISPRSSKIKEVFGGPHDPIQTEAVRREIENKIARLQHTVRSLSDSAISSDYTDCDSSSPRGNRVYDSDRKLINKRQRNLSNSSKSPKRMENVDDTEPRRTLNFESEAVQKFPFKDSGSILDEESNSQNEGDKTDLDEEFIKSSVLKDTNRKTQQCHGKLQGQFIPLTKPVGKFPETVIGAVLALKPFPLQRSVSLDSIATLVNTGTSLSRAARESQSIEDLPNGNQMEEIQETVKEAYPFVEHENKGNEIDVHDQYGQAVIEARKNEVDENEYLLSSGGLGSQCGDRPLSPGEIGIGQGSIDDMVAAVDNENIVPDIDIPVASVNTKRVPEKATSMSFLDERHNPEYQRSLSEGNIGDLDDHNDTSCTSNDSITFVFVGKEYNNGNNDNADGCNPYEEDDIEMLQNAADTVSEHNKLNISGRRYSSCSSGNESECNSVVLSRSASDQSVVMDDNTEDQVSTHSASEEVSGIIKSNSQRENFHSPRDIGVMMKTDTPMSYSDISEGPVVHRNGSIEDEDSAPLRHRFGIDESVLPIPERSVSADNIPKQVSTLKDMNRSRSTSMLDMAVVDNDESESGIFPPALSYVDEDQTEVSVSLRTMSEGALDQISQRSISDRAVTFSDQTSSDLQSSEMESSCVRSVCSNASSVEEIVEEYSVSYNTNNPRLRSTSDDNDDDHIFEEEEHIREVLRTVEKFFLPTPILANKATSTDLVDVTVAELDEQSLTLDNSTQTSQAPTVLQPNQIILPALAAPFRSQSVDSFGLGSYTQDMELSEGAQNWCTLGELMVETTHLLRTINEKLPDLERRGSVSSEESQAILKQWQEISIQTGNSMQDLHTVGLHTSEHDEEAFGLSCGTQTDKDFRMETLETSEMLTTDLIPLPLDIMVCDVSVQTGDDTTEDTDEQNQESTIDSSKQLNIMSPVDNTKVTEPAQGIDTEDKVVPSLMLNQQTLPNTPANTRTTAQFVPQVKAELGLEQPLSSDLPTEDSNTTSPGISPRGVRQTLTLPNTPEVEELRKEHNRLMENLRKASENRKARKDTIKSRKQVPVDLNISDKTTDGNDTLQTSATEKLADTVDANSSFTKSIPDTRSSVSSSLTSPQDFVKIDIQIDPNTGVTVENTFFQERQKRNRNREQPFEIHEHSWRLLKDKDSSKNVIKPETRESRQRNGSGASASSTDTTESSEVATVMARPSTNPVDCTAERAGALNPVFMNENNVVDDVLEANVLPNRNPPLSNLLDRMTRNLEMKPEESQPVFSISESEPESTVEDDVIPQHYSKKETLPVLFKIKSNKVTESNDPRERGHAQHPVFIRSETSPKVKNQKQYPPPPESPGSVSGNSVDSSSSSDLKPNLRKDEVLIKDLLPHLVRSKPGNERFANEDIIVPEIHNREHALPPCLEKDRNKKQSHFDSDSASEDDKVVEDQVEPVKYNRNHALPSNIYKPDTPNRADRQALLTQPHRSRDPPTFRNSDYSTQVSVEFSDDCTQTDPDTSIESVINQTKAKPTSNSPSKQNKSEPSSKEQTVPENLTNELERLQDQRLHMIEMLNMSHMPPSLTVELLEAKLNYCIGQTDLLLDGMEDNVREDPLRNSSDSSNEHQKTVDYITKYRAALKKSKEDINECRNRLNKKSEVGLGRGRTPIRRRDMQKQWHIDAFKLERQREQQDYERSRHNTPNKGNTPHQGNTPLYGNTPLLGNSPVVTPRSTDRSRSSSPTYSPGYMTPKEHKGHLVDLRRQLIAEVMEEERQYRSQSPALSVSPPPRNSRPRDGSLGFSPKTSLSSFDVPERSLPTYNTFSAVPGRSPPSPKRLPFNRYKSPVETMYPETFDTRTVAESIFSPQESEAILREIEEYKKKTPSMSAPMEELLRRSSFSSTSSQRSGSSRTEPFLSPRSHSDSRSRTPRKSTSPVARQPDYSQPLSLNLDSLNDDDSQPYSPYSAYAREHVLPRERSPGGAGGVVRGTYELYNSSSNSQSDSSSVLSFGSDLDTSHRPRINSLDEETVKRLRPVCADDIKARLGRHKR